MNIWAGPKNFGGGPGGGGGGGGGGPKNFGGGPPPPPPPLSKGRDDRCPTPSPHRLISKSGSSTVECKRTRASSRLASFTFSCLTPFARWTKKKKRVCSYSNHGVIKDISPQVRHGLLNFPIKSCVVFFLE